MSGIDRNMCCGTHVSNLSQVQVHNVEIPYTSTFNPTVKCDPIRKHIQTLGSLNNYDGDGNKKGKNAIGLDHVLMPFCTFLRRHCTYDVKLPDFTFYGGREHMTTIFFFFL